MKKFAAVVLLLMLSACNTNENKPLPPNAPPVDAPRAQ